MIFRWAEKTFFLSACCVADVLPLVGVSLEIKAGMCVRGMFFLYLMWFFRQKMNGRMSPIGCLPCRCTFFWLRLYGLFSDFLSETNVIYCQMVLGKPHENRVFSGNPGHGTK